jgi:hypothetical protein
MKWYPIKSIIVSGLFLTLLPTIGFGADYQSMTTSELSELRGTMANTSEEKRDAFRAEWKKRIDQMTEEEKQQYFGADGGRGQGSRSGDGLGDGSGRGKGGGMGATNSNGVGQGNGQGVGKGPSAQ